jgi:membrane protein implicated in regulation of membrane protease activity
MKHHDKSEKRTRLNSSIIWFGATQLLTVMAAGAAAVGENAFRLFALGSVTMAMLVSLVVSFQAGLMAMILFEPFRGFLRRLQYLIVPYSNSEPIHLITPVVTFVAFLLLLQRYKLEIFRASSLAGTVSILGAIYFLQIFNPLQGGLFVGLTGALFFLVPVAWFYFGQVADFEFVPRVLRLVVILGMVASFYGVYQMVFGYPSFEQYWIDNTDLYTSIAVYNVKRALATFNSAEEWGRYVQIGCIVAFGLGVTKTEGSKRLFWFVSGAVLILMLALTGQRSSIFGLFLGLTVLFLTGASSARAAFARVALLFAPLILVSVLSAYVGEDDGRDLDDGQSVNTMLTHTTKGTVKPAGEGSLYARFETWTRILTKDLPSNPVGNGIGSDGLAASRETKNTDDPTDNHFLSVALAAGVPALLLLIWIFIRSLILSFRLWRDSDPDSSEYGMWRIALALMASFFLNNFFGTSFTIYSVAPIGWLVIGWISAAYTDRQNNYELNSHNQREMKFVGFN